MKATCLVLFLGLAAASVSFGEINSGYTAEWLSHQSDLIAVAKPAAVETFKGDGEMRYTKTRFAIVEIYKGPLSAGDTVSVYDLNYSEEAAAVYREAFNKKQPLLIFCRPAEDVSDTVNGKYMFTVFREFKSVYSPDASVEDLYTRDFQLLTRYEDLLHAAQEQIRQEKQLSRQSPSMRVIRRSLEVPPGSPAYSQLYAGSSCYLWVPEYIQGKAEPDM